MQKQISPNVLFKKWKKLIIHFLTSPLNGLDILEDMPLAKVKFFLYSSEDSLKELRLIDLDVLFFFLHSDHEVSIPSNCST